MFALRRQATETATCDVSAAVARVMRAPAARDSDAEGKVPGVIGACTHALSVLAETQAVLSAASKSVREAAAYVIEAASADDAERALLAERYDDARGQVNAALESAPEGALSLLKPDAERMTVHLTGAVYAVAPFPLSTDEYGLDLPPPEHGFVSHAEVADTLRRVEIALERIGKAKAVYEEDIAFLRRRAERA